MNGTTYVVFLIINLTESQLKGQIEEAHVKVGLTRPKEIQSRNEYAKSNAGKSSHKRQEHCTINPIEIPNHCIMPTRLLLNIVFFSFLPSGA